MPPWLAEVLQDPAKAGGSMAGIAIAIISGVVIRVLQWRAQQTRAMSAVPPTVCPPVPSHPSQGTVIATARRIWELEQQVLELRGRLATVDADKQASDADLSRTAAALNASEQRAEALAAELAGIRRHIESGFTRLPLPVSGTGFTPIKTVVEFDAQPLEDKPTPTQGRARVRLSPGERAK